MCVVAGAVEVDAVPAILHIATFSDIRTAMRFNRRGVRVVRVACLVSKAAECVDAGLPVKDPVAVYAGHARIRARCWVLCALMSFT